MESPGLGLDLQEPLDPFPGMLLGGACPRVSGLVYPVGGDAGLRHRIHHASADLEFDGGAERTEEHRVERLIAVWLGKGDIVLEPAGHRFVQAMEHAEDAR